MFLQQQFEDIWNEAFALVWVEVCLSLCVMGPSWAQLKGVSSRAHISCRRVCQVLHWALKSSPNASSLCDIFKALRSGFCNEICCYRCISRLEEKWMIHVIEVNYWWGQSLLPGQFDVQLARFCGVWFAVCMLRSCSPDMALSECGTVDYTLFLTRLTPPIRIKCYWQGGFNPSWQIWMQPRAQSTRGPL